MLLFNVQILNFCGESALSVYSVISNCVILVKSLFTGVGQTIQPIIATNYGAGKWDRIRGIRRMSYLTITIMGAVFSLSGILFPLVICGVFMEVGGDIEMLAQNAIRIYFIAFLPMGINLLSSYYLQSVLKIRSSLCISLLRNIFLSSIAILTFPLILGGDSLWFVMPAVEIVVFFVSIILVKAAKVTKDKTA